MYFSGQNNVAGVDLCLREKNCIVFVMPYQPHDAFNVSVVQCKIILCMDCQQRVDIDHIFLCL